MNRVSVGSIYTASWAYSGENTRGKYEMLRITNEKGKEPITVFVNNCPTGIARGERFVINKVTDVIVKWRKDKVWNAEKKQREDGWVQEFDINADVTRVDAGISGIDVEMPNEFDVDMELPWDEQLPL